MMALQSVKGNGSKNKDDSAGGGRHREPSDVPLNSPVRLIAGRGDPSALVMAEWPQRRKLITLRDPASENSGSTLHEPGEARTRKAMSCASSSSLSSGLPRLVAIHRRT